MSVAWTKTDLNLTERDEYEWQNPWFLVITPSMISAIIWGTCYIIDIWAAMSNFHWLSFLTPIIKSVRNSARVKGVLAFSLVLEIVAQFVVFFLFPNQPIRIWFWLYLISVGYVGAIFVVCTFCAIDIIGTLIICRKSNIGNAQSIKLKRALFNLLVILSFIILASMGFCVQCVLDTLQNADVLLNDLKKDDKRNTEIIPSTYNPFYTLYGLIGFMCSLHVFYRIYQMKKRDRTTVQVSLKRIFCYYYLIKILLFSG
jgi:hypothetical protein